MNSAIRRISIPSARYRLLMAGERVMRAESPENTPVYHVAEMKFYLDEVVGGVAAE